MKKFILTALTVMSVLPTTHAQTGRVYGNEIVLQSLPVRRQAPIMRRDTVGSNAQQALINAENQCQIYINDMVKQGYTVYSYRAYAWPGSSPYVWTANCEATVPR